MSFGNKEISRHWISDLYLGDVLTTSGSGR